MTKMMVQIDWVEVAEGNLYAKMGEDGELIVFDTTFIAIAADGRRFRHVGHVVKGAIKNPDGFWVANRNYANEARRFVARVEARGFIDLAYWEACEDAAPEGEYWDEDERAAGRG
jgi:hypothetical protein